MPAIDWNTRSTGAPRSMARVVVVTWVSTQDCVGISKRRDDVVEHGEQVDDRRHVVAGRVDADHRVAAAEQQAVEDGGGDAARVVGRVIGLQPHGQASRAGRACRGSAVTTSALARRPAIRSWLRMSLRDGGRHLGREARGERAQGPRVVGVVGRAASRGSRRRSCATTGAKAAASWRSTIRRVTSSALVGDQRLGQEALSAARRPAPSGRRRSPRRCAAATPASTSPERGGVALAISSFRSENR